MKRDPPTKTRYDKNRIYVETTFGGVNFSVNIRLKFKASREAWLKAWKTAGFLENLSLADVKPFLGRNKKESVQALAGLAENHQAIFAQGFLSCVLAANGENSLFTKQPRGSVYPIRRRLVEGIDTWEVSKLALLLDTYLCYMENFSTKQWPQYLMNFYTPYWNLRVEYYAIGLKAGKPPTKPFPSIIVWALEKHFGCKFSNDSFRTFVQKKRLTLKSIIPTPESDPTLKKFFDQFQE